MRSCGVESVFALLLAIPLARTLEGTAITLTMVNNATGNFAAGRLNIIPFAIETGNFSTEDFLKISFLKVSERSVRKSSEYGKW